MKKILVVDNEQNVREMLAIALTRAGYTVETAEDGGVALEMLENGVFDLLLTDLKMPRLGGLELLNAAGQVSPETVAVVMTAFASMETAIEAMKRGAYDYVMKPFRIDEVSLVLHNALERKRLMAENSQMRQEIKEKSDSEVVGKSPAWLKVLDMVHRIADSRSNVLITGESGTGKEVIARAIHFQSGRQERPFITVNCGALPEPLLESEMFGHMKGAFTGAIANKPGLFEVADTGSLFLDEIGEMPLSIQAKLLRALQEKEIRRVGGIQNIPVDVRIIAATHQPLETLIETKAFREDLYYRLDVLSIKLPPLRERPLDIPLLVAHLLKKFNQEMGKNVVGVASTAMQCLTQLPWKGNVRELANVIERVMAMAMGPELSWEDFQSAFHTSDRVSPIPASIPQEGVDMDQLIAEIEQDLMRKAMERTQGVKTEAARLLHIDLRSFRYRFDKYNLDKDKAVPPLRPEANSGE